ncbi:hypothetical protein BaRGS_00012664 [Batillaria attramentaria]|uniref:Uncharacterized protein n=1 Tax=Batillaria attramentaria TaxID=370345 RepID=A0ABD0L9N9_9CAEN
MSTRNLFFVSENRRETYRQYTLTESATVQIKFALSRLTQRLPINTGFISPQEPAPTPRRRSVASFDTVDFLALSQEYGRLSQDVAGRAV